MVLHRAHYRSRSWYWTADPAWSAATRRRAGVGTTTERHLRVPIELRRPAEDALVALIINPSIQACILTPRFASSSEQRLSTSLRDFVRHRLPGRCSDDQPPIDRIVSLAAAIACLRPEIDLYLLAGAALETLAGALNGQFRRIFARTDALDLHLSLLGGIAERYRTPFFTALQDYAANPAASSTRCRSPVQDRCGTPPGSTTSRSSTA